MVQHFLLNACIMLIRNGQAYIIFKKRDVLSYSHECSPEPPDYCNGYTNRAFQQILKLLIKCTNFIGF